MTDYANGISSEAVRKATGRTWNEWFALLDADAAHTLAHPAIALLLGEKYGVQDWWRQMVTVAYEQERGLRERHQKADGFAVSLSKTVNVPVEALFAAWADAEQRELWLPDAPLSIRKATQPKSARMDWEDGATRVSAEFSAKGPNKSQVSLQHSKLPDSDAAGALRVYWSSALVRLKLHLEGRS